MVYLPTFTINLSQMQANTPYLDPMGKRGVPPSISRFQRSIYRNLVRRFGESSAATRE